MKTKTNIIIIAFLTFVLGCGQTANQDKKSIDKIDTHHTTTSNNELTKEEREKQIAEENRIDSLRLDIAIKDAFKIAQTEFKTDNKS